MPLDTGSTLGVYGILGSLGAGGPASVRAQRTGREVRRGLAEAKQRTSE
jgi:hypothetical protein